MITVPTWQDAEITGKEVKSCDNKEVGHTKEGDGPLLVAVRGMRLLRIPKESVATFDGERVYLRATEAEVLAGVYPFISGNDSNREPHT